VRYPVPPLHALHAFEAAARLGSLTAAGQELHLSTSAVSHRVRSLEAHLGFALFERLPRSLRLTDLGKAYLPAIRGVFDELTTATVGLFGAPGSGRVTVRAPTSYGARFLAPRLAAFTAAHDVGVWLVSALWSEEASELAVDLEVEFGDERLASAEAETLGHERAVLVAAPSNPAPGAATPLPGRVHVLGFQELWQHLDANERSLAPTESGMTVDTWSAALELVEHSPGYGALIPEALASHSLQTGRLARLGEVAVGMRQTYRVVRVDRPSTSSATTETTAFVEWLRGEHAQLPSTD
jgi:LysR family glycine cleavage system transcriptional activator